MTDVTPELAAAMLAHGRKINISRVMVDTLAEKMRRGTFEERPDEPSIRIREDGKLCGGHHRLRAVVQSGVTVRLRVDGLDRVLSSSGESATTARVGDSGVEQSGSSPGS